MPTPPTLGVPRLRSYLVCALIPILAFSSAPEAETQEFDYQRAEQLLTRNTAKLISGDVVTPNWRPDGNRFWYRVTTDGGADYVLADPAANTLQVVAALIKANKTFNLLILPDMDHGVTQDPYVIRRSWDYWVEHLPGQRPPVNYRIREPSN